ncbi:MAG: hypothetical protein GF411_11450 [Candidatus Lokiarchaeota archaeon]|nr:hypothetical protein [Candidatus Lokiarchaeota archaeon]
MSQKIQDLTDILRGLEQGSDVNGSALVTDKGQLICASLHSDVDERAVAAMGAAMLSIGTRVGKVLNSGDMESIEIDGEDSLVIVRHIGKTILIATAPPDAKVGLIEFEVDRAQKEIENLL